MLPSASGGTLTSSLFIPTLGEIYDEFERDLRRWRERYRDRPELELQRLLLLALDRVSLFGMDMGGQPALAAASCFPDRIASVIV